MKTAFFSTIVLLLFGSSLLTTAQENTEIAVNVAVESDKSGFIPNLKAEDFRIKLGKTIQKITSVQIKDEPVSFGILVDISGSTGKDRHAKNPGLKLYVEGLKQFINKSNAVNEYFISTFNTTTYPLINNTQSRDAVIQALTKLPDVNPSGNTSFYDVIGNGLEKLSTSKFKKRVLLVVSDGTDNSSKSSFSDVSKILKSSNVLLYSVSFDPGGFAGFDAIQGFAFLDNLTSLSGGKSLYVKKADSIDATFVGISDEIRSQYTIGFIPSEPKNGEFKKIKVEVNLPENGRQQKDKIRIRYRQELIY